MCKTAKLIFNIYILISSYKEKVVQIIINLAESWRDGQDASDEKTCPHRDSNPGRGSSEL